MKHFISWSAKIAVISAVVAMALLTAQNSNGLGKVLALLFWGCEAAALLFAVNIFRSKKHFGSWKARGLFRHAVDLSVPTFLSAQSQPKAQTEPNRTAAPKGDSSQETAARKTEDTVSRSQNYGNAAAASSAESPRQMGAKGSQLYWDKMEEEEEMVDEAAVELYALQKRRKNLGLLRQLEAERGQVLIDYQQVVSDRNKNLKKAEDMADEVASQNQRIAHIQEKLADNNAMDLMLGSSTTRLLCRRLNIGAHHTESEEDRIKGMMVMERSDEKVQAG